MSIDNISTNSIKNTINNTLDKVKKQSAQKSNFLPYTTTSTCAGTFNLKMGGLGSRALPCGSNVTVYKSETYTDNNPMLRVVTTAADGKENKEEVDPKKVDVSNATESEMFALNSYLVNQGKLDDDIYSTGIYTSNSISDTKRNYVDIVKELMDMQYRANNLSGYAKYYKNLSIYDTLR